MIHNLKKLPILWQNPGAIPYIIKELFQDTVNDMKKYDYPNKLIHIAGLPKGGSTWVFSLLSHLPGYNPCPGIRRALTLSPLELNLHDISQQMFDKIPKDKYTILKLHTRPSANNLSLLERNNAKTIVVLRDLRDMAISRFEHERTDRKSWCYYQYKMRPFEESFWHNLHVVHNHYLPWVEGWLNYNDYTGEPPAFVFYEDLKEAPECQLHLLLAELGIYVEPEILVEKEQKKTKRKKNLWKNLNKRVPTRERSTYSGVKRVRENYFTPEQEEWFWGKIKEVSLRCGYDR